MQVANKIHSNVFHLKPCLDVLSGYVRYVFNLLKWRKILQFRWLIFRRSTDYPATFLHPLLFSLHFIRENMRETELLNSFKEIFRCLLPWEDWDAEQMEVFTHSLDLEV